MTKRSPAWFRICEDIAVEATKDYERLPEHVKVAKQNSKRKNGQGISDTLGILETSMQRLLAGKSLIESQAKQILKWSQSDWYLGGTNTALESWPMHEKISLSRDQKYQARKRVSAMGLDPDNYKLDVSVIRAYIEGSKQHQTDAQQTSNRHSTDTQQTLNRHPTDVFDRQVIENIEEAVFHKIREDKTRKENGPWPSAMGSLASPSDDQGLRPDVLASLRSPATSCVPPDSAGEQPLECILEGAIASTHLGEDRREMGVGEERAATTPDEPASTRPYQFSSDTPLSHRPKNFAVDPALGAAMAATDEGRKILDQRERDIWHEYKALVRHTAWDEVPEEEKASIIESRRTRAQQEFDAESRSAQEAKAALEHARKLDVEDIQPGLRGKLEKASVTLEWGRTKECTNHQTQEKYTATIVKPDHLWGTLTLDGVQYQLAFANFDAFEGVAGKADDDAQDRAWLNWMHETLGQGAREIELTARNEMRYGEIAHMVENTFSILWAKSDTFLSKGRAVARVACLLAWDGDTPESLQILNGTEVVSEIKLKAREEKWTGSWKA